MNSGKSTSMGELVEELFTNAPTRARVLLVTTRVTQGTALQGLFRRLGLSRFLHFYRAGAVNGDAPGIYLLQAESLFKLMDNEGALHMFSLIVLDEVRSLLKQLVAPTHRHHLQRNQAILRHLCAHSRCVFLDADALCDEMVADFCQAARDGLWHPHQLRVHNYTRSRIARDVRLFVHRDTFEPALVRAVLCAKESREQSGHSRPVVLCCRSKKRLKLLIALVFPSNRSRDAEEQRAFLQEHATYMFTGDTDVGMEFWDDPNAFLRQHPVDLIAYSAKVTVACDLTHPVSAVYLDATRNGAGSRDLTQMLGRPRAVDGDVINVLLPKPDDIAPAPPPTFEQIEAELVKNMLLLSEVFPDVAVVQWVPDPAHPGRHVAQPELPPEWVRRLHINSFIEAQKDATNFVGQLIHLFVNKGWRLIHFERIDAPPLPVLPTNACFLTRDDEKKAAGEQVSRCEQADWETAFLDVARAEPSTYRVLQRSSKKHQECVEFFERFPAANVRTLKHCMWYTNNRAAFHRARGLFVSNATLKQWDWEALAAAKTEGFLPTAGSNAVCRAVLERAIAIVGQTLQTSLAADEDTPLIITPEEVSDPKAMGACARDFIAARGKLTTADPCRSQTALGKFRWLLKHYGFHCTRERIKRNTDSELHLFFDPLCRELVTALQPKVNVVKQ
jgi:hypothetical protein